MDAIAVWLLGRHPHLAALLAQADCVVDEPSGVDLDPELMPYQVAGISADLRALAGDFAAYDRWNNLTIDVPPEPVPARAELLAAMEYGEQCQLRLLATLSEYGVGFCLEADGFVALGDSGRRVFLDWLDALRAEWGTAQFTGSPGSPVQRPQNS
ncbi:hypothetical protein ACFV9C_42765 [Kribbella sp. NPDC059898]|uniref:hypothetical protein n=1 Tax=Kribbella sp. NPDC059898 TaxID=3346995 RepID=UPI00365790AB